MSLPCRSLYRLNPKQFSTYFCILYNSALHNSIFSKPVMTFHDSKSLWIPFPLSRISLLSFSHSKLLIPKTLHNMFSVEIRSSVRISLSLPVSPLSTTLLQILLHSAVITKPMSLYLCIPSITIVPRKQGELDKCLSNECNACRVSSFFVNVLLMT